MNMEQLLLAGSEGQDLKRRRGRLSTGEEGSERSLALSPLRLAHTHVDKTPYRMNSRDATMENTTSFHFSLIKRRINLNEVNTNEDI